MTDDSKEWGRPTAILDEHGNPTKTDELWNCSIGVQSILHESGNAGKNRTSLTIVDYKKKEEENPGVSPHSIRCPKAYEPIQVLVEMTLSGASPNDPDCIKKGDRIYFDSIEEENFPLRYGRLSPHSVVSEEDAASDSQGNVTIRNYPRLFVDPEREKFYELKGKKVTIPAYLYGGPKFVKVEDTMSQSQFSKIIEKILAAQYTNEEIQKAFKESVWIGTGMIKFTWKDGKFTYKHVIPEGPENERNF